MSEFELAPAVTFLAITPSNTVNIQNEARGIYVGGAGDITAINASGAAILFAGVVAGTVLPIFTKRVNSTGTSATNLVALF